MIHIDNCNSHVTVIYITHTTIIGTHVRLEHQLYLLVARDKFHNYEMQKLHHSYRRNI